MVDYITAIPTNSATRVTVAAKWPTGCTGIAPVEMRNYDSRELEYMGSP